MSVPKKVLDQSGEYYKAILRFHFLLRIYDYAEKNDQHNFITFQSKNQLKEISNQWLYDGEKHAEHGRLIDAISCFSSIITLGLGNVLLAKEKCRMLTEQYQCKG